MSDPELIALSDLLRAVDEVSVGLGEAMDAIEEFPAGVTEMEQWNAPKRIAARAVLKGVEQLQDLTARLLRTILTLENEDLTGLSARAIADRAESLSLIGSSDRWSAVVKLRNQLVHEYPLSKEQQFVRFRSAWDANTVLMSTLAVVFEFLRNNDYPDQPA
ncbi:hypothetical protein [Sphingomonas bacterium]|uniref:hypothetical protein n=1 Tax=Sphingomonas bacterium TaxID=1895847 RepID=UPI0015762DAC|nr:hypothetical protein [Sphingomonas bacterium]